MKIVIMQMEDSVPENYHWFCFPLPKDTPEIGFQMMGHKVVDLPEDEAQELLDMAKVALAMQFKLRDLYHPRPDASAYHQHDAPMEKESVDQG